MVPISSRIAKLASENAVADDCVDQHERKDDQAAPPEHEHKTGLRRGGFVDGDDIGDHVWPERQRQGAKSRHEDQRHHVEWPMVIVTQDAEREYGCGHRSNRREYEEVRPINPAMQDWKVFRQRISEDNHKKYQHGDRENGNLPMRHVTALTFAFLRQPTGAEKRVAKAEPDAAQYRKRRQPAEGTTGILAVRDLQSFHQRADHHPLDKSRDQGSAGKAEIPDPPQPLRFIAKLERHAAQDQAQQHDDDSEIERRHHSRVDEWESSPQNDGGHNQPGLVAVPDRRDCAQHRAAPGFAVRESEQQADPEIDPVEKHIEEDADGQKRDPKCDHGYSPAPAWLGSGMGSSSGSGIG